jgi:hypothetical protein
MYGGNILTGQKKITYQSFYDLGKMNVAQDKKNVLTKGDFNGDRIGLGLILEVGDGH